MSGGARCRELFARLSEYVDGELDPEPCARIERHLRDCAPCERFLESLRRTLRALEDAGSPPPLPDELRRALSEAGKRLEREAN